MIYLVDANVLSEATRIEPNRDVLKWIKNNERSLVVDPIILGEIQIGILSLPRSRKRTRLEAWYRTLRATIDCLPWDENVSTQWAILVANLKRRGMQIPALDSMIAATALTYGLVVATRNTSDFRRAGVKVVNPFT